MTRNHRRLHMVVWLIVAPIVAVVLLLSFLGMPR
jgi:hypothetical protein